jgi:TPR repeat protein
MGVIQDYTTAIKWYTLAAEQGDTNSQNQLGHMYASGQGVKDDIHAHMWYNIAASLGGSHSRYWRDEIAREMTSSQIEKAQKLARECVAKNYKGC